MKKKIRLLCISTMLAFNTGFSVTATENWNILNKSMESWNQAGETEQEAAWKCSKTYLSADQADGYVHIWKFSGADGFLTPESYPAKCWIGKVAFGQYQTERGMALYGE